MSSDLRNANCYVIPLGGKGAGKVLTALRKVSPWIGGQVARRVRLKFAPKLTFYIDDSFDNADKIQQLLQRNELIDNLQELKICDDGA